MKRKFLVLTGKVKKTAECIRKQTKLQDIVKATKKLKWKLAGHITRTYDNRRTNKVTEWIPYDRKRNRGKPQTR